MYVETKLQVKIYSFCILTMHCIVIATICLFISTIAKEFKSIEDNKKHDITAINVFNSNHKLSMLLQRFSQVNMDNRARESVCHVYN